LFIRFPHGEKRPPSLANQNGANLLRFWTEGKDFRAFPADEQRNSVHEPKNQP
jgi:hypothetical protein